MGVAIIIGQGDANSDGRFARQMFMVTIVLA